MHFSDHPPPHFHACYAEYEAAVDIASGSLLSGAVPVRADNSICMFKQPVHTRGPCLQVGRVVEGAESRRGSPGPILCPAGRALADRAVLVLMLDVLGEDLREVAGVEDQETVKAFPSSGPTNLSANAFAFGDRTGVLMTLVPSERNTSSKLAVSLGSQTRSLNAQARRRGARSGSGLVAWPTRLQGWRSRPTGRPSGYRPR